MKDFSKQRTRKVEVWRFMLGVVVVCALFFLTVGAVRAAWGMYGKFEEAAASNDAAQKNLAQLKLQQANVEAQVEALSTAEGEEAGLRQAYGVARPGEGQIQIVRQAEDAETPVEQSSNFFVRIFRALFVW
jgi:cell division protein FtsB